MKKNKKKSEFLEQLRKIPIVQVSCEKVGISRNSVYRWKKEDEKFSKEMEEALAEGEDLVNDMGESQLLSLMKDKHWPSIAFWLSRRHPKFKNKLEISGQVTHRERREYTEEEKELFKEALRLAMPKDVKPEEDNSNKDNHGTDQ